ncbi:hypothetical protein COY32_06020 [candidate division WWE3 bacterium CG_4_10_14_0_2_um_filter_41_14]|uniref:Uncharacterized protein n=1 Tax=candidate division WWE3 bacterium CG_4_10_14_0_2_um_filter_41_14 TaxID=1975072 RepID=A0A2M7TFV8_UNCKA|nr:MAG: hypothetical protein COY32_06020 [candidate division WWE3 bacterium CG_4_10_14_0_2_um_filter_41_14]
MKKYRKLLPLIILIGVGSFLRLYGIDWGEGYFFHPDERNIISAVSNLSITKGNLNPLFWAYGAGPIYLIYFYNLLMGAITQTNLMEFSHYMISGRLLSATASIVIIPFTYIVTKRMLENNSHAPAISLLTATWVTFSPGMIQFAHFVSYEGFLTLEYLALLLSCFAIIDTGTKRSYLVSGVLLGLSIGTKITSIVLLPLVILAHIMRVKPKTFSLALRSLLSLHLISTFTVSALSAFLISPYHILDWSGFTNSLSYEGGVANGSIVVFYTQQFIGTIPGWYQLTQVFPYIFTIPLTLLFVVAFVWSIVSIVKNAKNLFVNNQQFYVFLLVALITLYLIFHMLLFVKWTRYMIPAIPFMAILVGVFVSTLEQKFIRNSLLTISTAWIVLSGLWFMQVYERTDSRIQAAQWVKPHVQQNKTIGSEIYDLGILPTNDIFPTSRITLYNVYDSDEIQSPSVEKMLSESDYFMVLSQRIYKTRLENPTAYPNGNALYSTLFNQTDGWERKASFINTDIQCAWWSLNCMNNIFPPDETFFVFDHPSVYIFKKGE